MEELIQKDIDSIIEENNFLKKLLKEAPVSFHINKVDEKGLNIPVWINDNYEKLVGYNLEERQSLGYADRKTGIYYEEDVESIRNAIKTLLEYRNLEGSILFRFYKKTGELRWVYVHSKAIVYKGDPNCFISVGFDITDRLVLNQNQLEIYTKEIARLKSQIKIDHLTRTEKEIIKDLAIGKSTKQIAEERNRSYETINNHKRNIFRKLECNKTVEIVALAKAAGLD